MTEDKMKFCSVSNAAKCKCYLTFYINPFIVIFILFPIIWWLEVLINKLHWLNIENICCHYKLFCCRDKSFGTILYFRVCNSICNYGIFQRWDINIYLLFYISWNIPTENSISSLMLHFCNFFENIFFAYFSLCSYCFEIVVSINQIVKIWRKKDAT